jgi:hypothetical protein
MPMGTYLAIDAAVDLRNLDALKESSALPTGPSSLPVRDGQIGPQCVSVWPASPIHFGAETAWHNKTAVPMALALAVLGGDEQTIFGARVDRFRQPAGIGGEKRPKPSGISLNPWAAIGTAPDTVPATRNALTLSFTPGRTI